LSRAARVLAGGAAAAIASALVAAACSRAENRHAARPLNAVAHIYDGGAPRKEDGPGRRNTLIGLALHAGASVWWAAFYEALFGRAARRSPSEAVAGGATIAAAAYVVDYHVVGERFRPGFERFLSGRSLFAVYAALAAGLALSAQLSRLRDHQVEDHDERQERRNAKRRPQAVVAPEERRQLGA
jgi:hypothetical protein